MILSLSCFVQIYFCVCFLVIDHPGLQNQSYSQNCPKKEYESIFKEAVLDHTLNDCAGDRPMLVVEYTPGYEPYRGSTEHVANGKFGNREPIRF